MTTLVIMRHAEAGHNHGSDHKRELTNKGLRQAREAGHWLRTLGLHPSTFVVSDALRTRQTADALDLATSYLPVSEAYNASAAELLKLVREFDDDDDCGLVVAHNPGVSELCWALGHRTALRPGCSIVVRFDGHWESLGTDRVDVVSSFVPSEH